MALDVVVRCNCFERGKTKPHPFPELLRYDQVNGPYLESSATEEQLEAHDRWFEDSCPHHGYADGALLGNITLIASVRKQVQALCTARRRQCPLLLTKVLYSGTHTGDHIAPKQVPKLLVEIRSLQRAVKTKAGREFLATLARVCRTSMKTGNPLLF